MPHEISQDGQNPDLLVYIFDNQGSGRLVPQKEATISVFDHGLLYGDGVFEGIRIYQGQPFRLEEHLSRLEQSAEAIFLTMPFKKEELEKAVIETVNKNVERNPKVNYIRLVATRGAGDLGLDIRKCPAGNIFIIVDKISLYPKETYDIGLRIKVAATKRTPPDSLNPKIKSLNYLNNILAKIEATNSGAEEALMLNHHGYVAECSGDNIFIVKGGILWTPPEEAGVLLGVTRSLVIEIAKGQGIGCEEKLFDLEELKGAEECFLTGTAAEIVPVVALDDNVIGPGSPGPVTQKLRQAFRDITERASEGQPQPA